MEKVSDEQYNGGRRPDPAAGQRIRAAAVAPRAAPGTALQQKIAPGLAALTDEVLYGDVWRRPELSPRDRSLVTISV